MLNRILVAIKFTPTGKQALLKALELAKDHGAELFVFHALDYALRRFHPRDPKITELQKNAAKRVARFIGPLETPPPRIAFTCRPADPALGACEEAAAIGAHMIIIEAYEPPQETTRPGSADYDGQTIMENAPCPVMMVP
jgi:nucleotide-binding universal stress UspA family protein